MRRFFAFVFVLLLVCGSAHAEEILVSKNGYKVWTLPNVECSSESFAVNVGYGNTRIDYTDAQFQEVVTATIDAIAPCLPRKLHFLQIIDGRRGGRSIPPIDAWQHRTGLRCRELNAEKAKFKQEVTGQSLSYLGYESAQRLYSSPELDFYRAYSSSSSFNVFIHKIGLKDPIGGISQDARGGARFDPQFESLVDDLLTCATSGNRFQARTSADTVHYVDGYDTDRTIQDMRREHSPPWMSMWGMSGRAHLSEPVLSMRWSRDRPSRKFLSSVLGYVEPLPVSAYVHCVSSNRLARRTESEITEACPGHVAVSNPLAARGFIASTLLAEDSELKLYRGTVPGSENSPGHVNAQVFVLEHDVGNDDLLIPFDGPPGGRIQRHWLDRISKLQPIADLIGTATGELRVDVPIHHYVTGFVHPNKNSRYGTEVPVTITRLRVDHTTQRLFHRATAPEIAPANSVTSALKVHERTQRYIDAVQDMGRSIPGELLESVLREDAQHYGYVRETAQFWDNVIGNSGTDDAQRIHNGDFSGVVGGNNLALYYTIFTKRFGEQCRHKLQPDHPSLPITTTETTVDRYGSSQQSSTVDVHLDREYVAEFIRHFEHLWKDGPKQTNAPVPLGEVFRLPGLESMYDLAQIKYQPARVLERFFASVDCDSPTMEQMRVNILRHSTGGPSIQASRQNYRGQRVQSEPVSVRQIYVKQSDTQFIYLVYAGGPDGWLPQSPNDLMTRVRNEFTPVMAHHISGWVHTLPGAEVVNPAYGALRRMTVTSLSGERTNDLLDIFLEMKELNIEWPPPGHDQLLVACEYEERPSVIFWLDKTPANASRAALIATHPAHPMLRIEAPREHCPARNLG